MFRLKWMFVIIVFMGAAACTAVPNPRPTINNTLADVVTVESTRPSATASPLPPTPTATEVLATETAVLSLP